jgi:anti-sigma B factor antagonist
MELTRRQIGSVLVLAFAESATLEGDTSARFKEKIRGLIGEGRRNLVIDLGLVTFIDSSGLGALISALKVLRSNGGDLKLVNVGEKVHSVLEITKLLRVFDTYATAEDALGSIEDVETLGCAEQG